MSAAAYRAVAEVLVAVHKAKDPRVLDRGGFKRAVASLTALLEQAAKTPEREAYKAVLGELARDWTDMTGSQRTAAMRRIESALLGAAPAVSQAVGERLADEGGKIALAARRETSSAINVPVAPHLDLVDQRVLDHAASSQALFVTDEYRRRGAAASARAREIVAAGLEDGLDHLAIGAELEAALGPLVQGRSAAYWPMLASVFAARSRTFGELTALHEAGIQQARWESVLDEVTCNACRFMHGRVFTVGTALRRYREVAEAEDPEAVRELQPFLQLAMDPDGRQAVFASTPAGRQPLGLVTRDAFGTKDDAGDFETARGGSQRIERLGCSSPPAHPRCRCTLTAFFG